MFGTQQLGALMALQPAEAIGISGDGFTTITGGASASGLSNLVHWRFNSGSPQFPNYVLSNSGVYPGGTGTTGLAVTDDGSMVVGYIRYPNGLNQAMRQFVGAAPVENLGALIPGPVESVARACSGDGSIIVGYSDGAIGTKAARWQAGAWTSLGALPGGANSYAYGVSRDGTHIVGFSEFAGSGTRYHPFVHTIAGGMVDLGLPPAPPGTFTTGYAWNVNDDATVIVGEARASQGSVGRATVWTPITGTILLADLLTAIGSPQGADLTLTDAIGVSGDGRTLAGNAFRTSTGQPVAWVLRSFSLAPAFMPSSTGTPSSLELCRAASGPAQIAYPAVRGLTPISLTWTRDGTPISPGDPRYAFSTDPAAPSCTLLNPGEEPTGTVFSCVATNPAGSTARSTTLQLSDPFAFTTHPGTFSTCINDPQSGLFVTVYSAGGPISARAWEIQIADAPNNGWLDLDAAATALELCGGQLTASAVEGGGLVLRILPCPGQSVYPVRQVLSGVCGSVVSEPGVYELLAPPPPVITEHPQSVRICPTGSATLAITTPDDAAFAWQLEAPIGSNNWTDLVDGEYELSAGTRLAVAGVNTATLSVAGIDTPLGFIRVSGSLRVRCRAAQCSSSMSEPAIITVCHADFNCDGEINPDDLGDFLNCYFGDPQCDRSDFNRDANIDPDDLGDFINLYFNFGC